MEYLSLAAWSCLFDDVNAALSKKTKLNFDERREVAYKITKDINLTLKEVIEKHANYIERN